ncbi:hypothetical protein CVIRNUC_004855 [Coccomyxa viridis]|uniref:Transmembrane protein n=1 Tax=Coccomyxa viridis TaxID=1274662 RepID=A0AAV1I612_9CHLO|nr:hypothetical protein CVIRNUC_004855 [Coccomyxa viridis]
MSVLRTSSARSTSSFDSLDEFLSEFEVISVDHQQALPTPLPLLTALHAPGDRSRPPRPAVRLSTQSYGTARQSRRQSHGEPSNGPLLGPGAGAGEYQDMALLPVSEPSRADAGHFYPTLPGQPRKDADRSRASERETSHASGEPTSPLSGYAEQLQRDLGSALGSLPSKQHEVPELLVTYPALTSPETSAQAQPASPPAAARQREAAPHAQRVAAPAQAASRPAASISSAPGASFTNPLVSLPAREHAEGAASSAAQGPAQKTDARAVRAPPSASTQTEPSILSPSRRQSTARTGIHPLSRSFESLLKEPTAALMSQQQRTDAAAAVSASPVQATVRASQQTLRKRDFESELLDRLLNGAQAAVPSQGQQVPPAGAKQPASCLHLPVPRVLLITVVFALMAIPLLLFTAGRVQAQHHMKQQLYVGSLAVNHSVEGPIPDPVALPAGIDNATGDHRTAVLAREAGLKSAIENSQTELQEYLSAKERRRTQPGLKLLSFRLTVSLPHGMPARLTGPRAILGDFAPIHSDV